MPAAAREAAVTLSARGLGVVFESAAGPVTAVRGFDLELRRGELVGLVGEPGCGKSTAALGLLGLVRAGGRIEGVLHYDGVDLLGDRRGAARLRGRRLALVTQSPREALHPMLDVGTQIANVCRAHAGLGRREARLRARALLASLGINDPERRAKAYPHQLSTGMAQRVVMAMALAGEPELLIGDEATSGLDVTIQAQILDHLWSLTREAGLGLLLVTQDLGIVANYCDRVLVMHEGTIVEDRPTRQFFAAPAHAYGRRIIELQRARAPEAAEPPEPEPADRSGPPLLELRSLEKRFPVAGSREGLRALAGVSLTLAEGESLGLVGESGSGKTTLGRCLLRLEEPTGGEILYRGQPVRTMAPGALRRLRPRLQIVFQDPSDSLNPRWSIERVVAEPLMAAGADAATIRRRVPELLEAVGLAPAVAGQRPVDLSAGRQQRIAIARALATDPELVVLDEPTSALTPETTAGLLALLARLQRERGISYLYISHDLATVRALCRRVAVMYLGEIVETGTVEAIFRSPRHPYTRALLDAHLEPDPTRRRIDRPDRATLTGEPRSPIDLPGGCSLAGRCPLELERCRSEPQTLATLPDGRQVRCWRAAEPG